MTGNGAGKLIITRHPLNREQQDLLEAYNGAREEYVRLTEEVARRTAAVQGNHRVGPPQELVDAVARAKRRYDRAAQLTKKVARQRARSV